MIHAHDGSFLADVGILNEKENNVLVASRNNNDALAAAQIPHLTLDVLEDKTDAWDEIPDTLEGLLYCPGSINLKAFQRLKEEDFLNDFRINVLGAVRTIQACIPRLKKNRGGSVVLISTVAAISGMNFHASIATAKAVLVALYDMHLRWDRPFNALVFVAAIGFLMLFIGIAMMDSAQYQPSIIQEEAASLAG